MASGAPCLFVCSVAAGWGVLLILCALGMGTLLLAVPALGRAMNLAGAAYLVWLAWKLIGITALGQAKSAHLGLGFWQAPPAGIQPADGARSCWNGTLDTGALRFPRVPLKQQDLQLEKTIA
jgi:hypothetical protein